MHEEDARPGRRTCSTIIRGRMRGKVNLARQSCQKIARWSESTEHHNANGFGGCSTARSSTAGSGVWPAGPHKPARLNGRHEGAAADADCLPGCSAVLEGLMPLLEGTSSEHGCECGEADRCCTRKDGKTSINSGVPIGACTIPTAVASSSEGRNSTICSSTSCVGTCGPSHRRLAPNKVEGILPVRWLPREETRSTKRGGCSTQLALVAGKVALRIVVPRMGTCGRTTPALCGRWRGGKGVVDEASSRGGGVNSRTFAGCAIKALGGPTTDGAGPGIGNIAAVGPGAEADHAATPGGEAAMVGLRCAAAEAVGLGASNHCEATVLGEQLGGISMLGPQAAAGLHCSATCGEATEATA